MPIMKYLNATCVEILTSNGTHLEGATPANIASCLVHPRDRSHHPAGITTFIIIALTSIMTFVIVSCCAACCAMCFHHDNIKHLRNLPSHRLHRELEKQYGETLSLPERERFEKGEQQGGRYKQVHYHDNPGSKERTIVIVENLNHEPSASARKEARTRSRAIVPAAQTRITMNRRTHGVIAVNLREPIESAAGPSTRASTPVVTQPDPVVLPASNQGRVVRDESPPPPAYTTTYREWV